MLNDLHDSECSQEGVTENIATLEVVDDYHVVNYDVENLSTKNYNFEQFLAHFKTTKIDISKYWLINIGFDEQGNKKYSHLIIRAYSTRPFYGPHLVSIFIQKNSNDTPEMSTIWVHSLTFLRKELFRFQDRLSFERSTFIIPHEDSGLIRLKSIRGFIEMPQKELVSDIVPASPKKQRTEGKVHELINHNIQNLIMFVHREKGIALHDCVDYIKHYVNGYCDELNKKLTP